MKSVTRPLSLVVLLLFTLPAYSAETPSSAPALTSEQKAALDVLDGVIFRFETLLNRDDDPQHKAATQAVLDNFKQRRAVLRQTYDQSRCEELRVDLNLEYQRLASWMAPPSTPPRKSSATVPATVGN